jgi:hypothetical protein
MQCTMPLWKIEDEMADKPSFPQIPTTVWWGLRQSLRRAPNATVDEGFLAVNLGVQPAAARQYLAELKRVALLTDDGRATPLAMKWRNDESYREAADEIVRSVYPQSLLDVAPPGEADRNRTTAWFMHNGLGEGTAKNKASTYLLMAQEPIQDAPEARSGSPQRVEASGERGRKAATRAKARPEEPKEEARRGIRLDSVPLNVNVQIHISADASGEQIEAIFSSMRRYLYDDRAA